MVSAEQQAAHELLVTDRFNVKVLPTLTKCVHLQVEQGWYDLDINLAILKLYQLHPNEQENVVELDILVRILALSLMRVPEADFRLCLLLVPEQYQSINSVVSLAKLAEKLEVCQFAAFWSELDKRAEVKALVPGLEDALRKSIVNTTALTYSKLDKKVFQEFVNCPVEQMLSSVEGLKVEGDFVLLPSSVSNQPKAATASADADAPLPQLAQVLANTLF
mmetsp:Transcript_24005/g.42329  ORF Transcript_24005/g.42329 Transcript_24005/m.42329 type:complete len:220 (+) Transcript_24005:51-710(+)|eukprot:CAMPEP_0184523374 /NCGR_PEP_ID=MMETSP0198_2-20121128/8845_1 /TAXON_ID=1112570 /ORGANISM="Thraustochytrium sp., Strain LLF1b" /LENGTH=219 /DNA_ID=CAMNT_0026914391 /DNA_START=33 /DNA_END=692 /DNA_ORIENTATION=+